ncbi:MAG: MOSC domain-containing protein [Candidatus Erginobacter occultus]|nr:MOSC domain-containing protein [Candidatus Erginobacter occultus]
MKEQQLTGEVTAVCVSDRKGVRKENVGEGILRTGWGLEGDAHAGKWHRQVSLLAVESMEKLARSMKRAAPGAPPPVFRPGDFAENLTVRGLELFTIPIGTRLRVGEEVVLEVTQIGKECHSGCAIRELTGDCVMPREGIFVKVIAGGKVKAGDRIRPDQPVSPQRPPAG